MEQRDAERVSDAVIAWESKGYESLEEEASDAAYQRATLSFRPARRPIRSFEEFRSIGVAKEFFFDEAGRPTPVFEAFKACVSLFTYPQAHINTASDAVLLSQGLDENQLALIRERQSEIGQRIVGTPPYFRVTDEVRRLIGGGANLAKFDDEIILMWVRVTVKEGLARCRISALVAVREDVAFPSAAANPDTDPDMALGGRTALSPAARTTGTSTAAPRSTTRSPTPYLTPGIEPSPTLGKSAMSGRVASNTVTYPFQILAWEEDNGAPPPPRPSLASDDPAAAPPTK